MSAWAAVAAKSAVIMSSADISLHGITPGALDGFALGALLTGACFLAISVPRLLRRNRLPASEGTFSRTRQPRFKRDYFANPADTGASPADGDAFGGDGELAAAADGRWLAAADPFDAFADDDVILPGTGGAHLTHEPSGRSGYHSKHRMPGSDIARMADDSRTPPRHAAAPPRLPGSPSGRSAAPPIAARG